MSDSRNLTLRDEVFDRVAKLLSLNVPVKQIAEAIGLSEPRVFAIAREEEVKLKVAELQTHSIEQMQTINDGWDALEELALGHVVEYMQTNPDPQFALQAARVANGAERRGYLGTRAINGGTGPRRSSICKSVSCSVCKQCAMNRCRLVKRNAWIP